MRSSETAGSPKALRQATGPSGALTQMSQTQMGCAPRQLSPLSPRVKVGAARVENRHRASFGAQQNFEKSVLEPRNPWRSAEIDRKSPRFSSFLLLAGRLELHVHLALRLLFGIREPVHQLEAMPSQACSSEKMSLKRSFRRPKMALKWIKMA